MATYVLVHGAWHGGWCWRKVTALLHASGQRVFAPSLTGLGDRAHLAHPAIDLDTHIQDIVNVLWYEDLEDVVLVGHSYAGMVLAGVAHRVPERLRHLVYLDAFVPTDGQCIFDFMPPDAQQDVRENARALGDGWRVPHGGAEGFGLTDEDDLEWVRPRLVDQPLETFAQPVQCPESTKRLPRTYIYCSRQGSSFTPFADDAQRDPSWRYREFPAGHDAMITAPQALTNCLLEVLDGTG